LLNFSQKHPHPSLKYNYPSLYSDAWTQTGKHSLSRPTKMLPDGATAATDPVNGDIKTMRYDGGKSF
jgi:hypothetical protein